MKSETKSCQNCQKDFIIESEDFAFYEKIKVPAPTWCPKCRLIRRLAHRNERSLYQGKCDLCNFSIITMYDLSLNIPIYCSKCFYSDDWDPIKYGKDYDFSEPFLEQFMKLQKTVPHLTLIGVRNIDSPWINYEGDSKNCYLNIGGMENKDSAFNQYLLKGIDCFDNYWFFRGDYCYENILCEDSYKLFNSIFCFDCRDTYFSFDCRNCSNVIGCSGLRNKQYHIFNKQVSEEEYQEFFDKNIDGSYKKREEIKKKSKEFLRSLPQRANFIQKSVNVSGDIIKESKNCHNALNAEKVKDSRFLLLALEVENSYDVTSIWKTYNSYEFMASFGASDILFSKAVLESSNIGYSSFILNSDYCFGCVSLLKKKYCILNKQYTKEKYFELVEKIKKHMDEMLYIDKKGKEYRYGEFFPFEASLFVYTETVANEWFPRSEEEIENWGLNADIEKKENKYEFSDYKIPDNIKDVEDDILEKILKCEKSGKAYKIISMELEFYRKFKIPIPRLSPFERHKERLAFITARQKSVKRICEACRQKTTSVYSKEEFPKIYCEECYKHKII